MFDIMSEIIWLCYAIKTSGLMAETCERGRVPMAPPPITTTQTLTANDIMMFRLHVWEEVEMRRPSLFWSVVQHKTLAENLRGLWPLMEH